MPTFYRRQQRASRPFRAKTYHPWWQRHAFTIVAFLVAMFLGRDLHW